MHIYIFGSICRGEYEKDSDIDLLSVINTHAESQNFDKNKFSIYTVERLKQLWEEGNPFAWHLFLEAKLVFSSDHIDLIKCMGAPQQYQNGRVDLEKFMRLYLDSYEDLMLTKTSYIFNLSCIFLAIRNFATCYSLHVRKPIFSRKSPLLIDLALVLPQDVFLTLERSRTLSTRGVGDSIRQEELEKVITFLPYIRDWMSSIIGDVYGGI